MLKDFLNELDEIEQYLTKFSLKKNENDDTISSKCNNRRIDTECFIKFEEFALFIKLLASLLAK